MNEMRRDPVTRKWVIIDKRIPVEQIVDSLRSAVKQDKKKVKDASCDFCPGNEASTRDSILELTDGRFVYRTHHPDWNVRVIPNRNPVFRIEGNLNRRLVAIYDGMDAIGAHEVIIENRNHLDWDEMSMEEVASILSVYRERMIDLSRDERFGHLFLFKNYGPSSNARMSHPHSTLIASPSVPERIRRELDFTRKHYQMKERCLFCDIITEESRSRNSHTGLIAKYENFVLLSPYFASHPFEMWILPSRHNSDFRTLEPAMFSELARVARESLSTVKKIVGPLSYTLLLFTRPNKIWGEERDYWTTLDEDYHWHFKFFPRFPRLPGLHRSFSVGSGYMINQVPPEIGAQILRDNLMTAHV
jgi:UDPglucose--hexose-1-phosphate uridylyltransferase